MIIVIIFNDNDYQYQFDAAYATKKCIGTMNFCVYDWLY